MHRFYVWIVIRCRYCSLMRTAMVFLYGFVPSIFILFVILLVTGCSFIEVKHREGRLPKIEVQTDIADDVEIKLDDDGVVIELEWKI